MRTPPAWLGALVLITAGCADQGNLTIRCPDAGGAITVAGGQATIEDVSMRISADLSAPADAMRGGAFVIEVQLPDSVQMRLFAQAGFSDVGAAANELTSPAGDPTNRIDYLWARGVDVRGVRTIRTTASDHRPVVADVAVR